MKILMLTIKSNVVFPKLIRKYSGWNSIACSKFGYTLPVTSVMTIMFINIDDVINFLDFENVNSI